ncbi:hypothetical protein BRARA_I03447 [Brassica rapa]|uniref:Uncharacterized protein n=1 Tax=Brassica campestris TaxID=3711 RepID=A0A397Y0T0_BRACM|nr:hypothetical protein BRARA_I03447 [Brassica rapa]
MKDYSKIGGKSTMQRTSRRLEGTAMGSTVFDLKPGVGIGPFYIGMPICDAFGKIEQDSNVYDVVHVKYYDEDPLKLDVVISFPDHGFHLRFDPSSQRLRLIEIYDVKRLQMRYGNSTIGGPSTLATFVACNFMISVGEGETEANRGGNKITPSTNWEQVKEVLGECGPAAIQTQGSTSNPFGSTYVYGYKDVAFEVMKNGHIATITLFQS